MTAKLSFACMHSEHWACPSHLGLVGFHCECGCHHDTITVHKADDKPAKPSNGNAQDTQEPA